MAARKDTKGSSGANTKSVWARLLGSPNKSGSAETVVKPVVGKSVADRPKSGTISHHQRPKPAALRKKPSHRDFSGMNRIFGTKKRPAGNTGAGNSEPSSVKRPPSDTGAGNSAQLSVPDCSIM